jgi:hypothetical protein
MTTYFCVELPLTAQPQEVTIRLMGTQYRIKLAWNVANQCWILDFSDTAGNQIAGGIPLVTGADLFEQFEYLNFDGQLLVYSDRDDKALVPGWDDLGNTGHALFFPNK